MLFTRMERQSEVNDLALKHWELPSLGIEPNNLVSSSGYVCFEFVVLLSNIQRALEPEFLCRKRSLTDTPSEELSLPA